MTLNTHFSIAHLQQQAENGSASAQFALGLFYLPKAVWKPEETGNDEWAFIGSLHSKYQVQKFGGESSNEPIVDQAFELAEQDIQENINLAFKWFEKAAKNGHDVAQYATARCYYEGIGIERNDELAFEWVTKSEAQGFVEALILLGDLYSQSNCITQDELRALDYYKKAKEHKIPGASFKITKMLFKGVGVKDYEEGAKEIKEILVETKGFLGENYSVLAGLYEHANDDRVNGYHYTKIEQCDDDELKFYNALNKLKFLSTRLIDILDDVSQSLFQHHWEKEKMAKAHAKELEDMMSMFAHKFRSPLDAIIYNTEHENQPKLYAQAAQTMRGLLDVFSIISTDETVLKDRLMQDMRGESGLMPVFDKTLNMILLHLLSASGAEKIQQHYLGFAKTQGLCDPQLSFKRWNEDHYELERQLQRDWEQSYAQLLNQSAPLEQRLAWLEDHFFTLELHGLDRANIQFKEYGVTESFLTILLNEILVNAFKYYSSADKRPVLLEWRERDGFQVLSCRNPSLRSERTLPKGSGKGHTFLSALARKTGSQFSKPKPQDDFVLEFGIADELLKAN
ncbi:MAG TPA: hypothetical protein DCZ48_08490 [Methylococcaceae bacterium]|nr:hypothetical protein [Methylococcaceae bacterium]